MFILDAHVVKLRELVMKHLITKSHESIFAYILCQDSRLIDIMNVNHDNKSMKGYKYTSCYSNATDEKVIWSLINGNTYSIFPFREVES